jgi:hypothetical protein
MLRIEDAQINQVIESSKQSIAASTIPCEMPNFIFLGAKLATITVSRPSKSSGL